MLHKQIIDYNISVPTVQYPDRQIYVCEQFKEGNEVYLAQQINGDMNVQQVTLKFQSSFLDEEQIFIQSLIDYQNSYEDPKKQNYYYPSGLIRIYETITWNEKQIIVMEVGNINLFEYLTRARSLTLQEKQSICRQIAKSIQMLHYFGYVHRDIKPENFILVGKDWKLQIKNQQQQILEQLNILHQKFYIQEKIDQMKISKEWKETLLQMLSYNPASRLPIDEVVNQLNKTQIDKSIFDNIQTQDIQTWISDQSQFQRQFSQPLQETEKLKSSINQNKNEQDSNQQQKKSVCSDTYIQELYEIENQQQLTRDQVKANLTSQDQEISYIKQQTANLMTVYVNNQLYSQIQQHNNQNKSDYQDFTQSDLINYTTMSYLADQLIINQMSQLCKDKLSIICCQNNNQNQIQFFKQLKNYIQHSVSLMGIIDYQFLQNYKIIQFDKTYILSKLSTLNSAEISNGKSKQLQLTLNQLPAVQIFQKLLVYNVQINSTAQYKILNNYYELEIGINDKLNFLLFIFYSFT